MNNWLLYVGNIDIFEKSKIKNIWRIQSDFCWSLYFLDNVKNGDTLWFVISRLWNDDNGQLIGSAVYSNFKRVENDACDIEIKYTNFKDYTKYNFYSNITSNCPVKLCKKPPDAKINSFTCSIKLLHLLCKSQGIKGYSMYKKKEDKNKLLKLLEDVCIS